jgi:serine/threonine protein phosphatase PrpC
MDMSEGEEIRRQKIEDQVYAVSHPGGREHNEDHFLATRWDHGWILAVADGLGGHRAGEVASRCAIESLVASLSRMEGQPTEALFRRWFQEAHEAIRLKAEGPWTGMGTTLVAAGIAGSAALFAHTGDSRAYVIRDRILFHTRDHSVVQDLIDGGILTEEEAHRHPMKNMLTAALGIDFSVTVEKFFLASGDTVLCASDGFYDFISEKQLVDTLHTVPFPDCGEVLLHQALEETTDNVTFVIYRVP